MEFSEYRLLYLLSWQHQGDYCALTLYALGARQNHITPAADHAVQDVNGCSGTSRNTSAQRISLIAAAAILIPCITLTLGPHSGVN